MRKVVFYSQRNYRRRLEYVETTQMGELVELHYRKPKES